MRPDGLTIAAGGTPAEVELAALTAAVGALLDEEAATAADPLPAAYRSAWRRAAIREALEAGAHP